MGQISRADQMHIIKTVFARAEEQGDVDLNAAAAEFDVKPKDLVTWVTTVTDLERRLEADGGMIGDAYAYSADGGVLVVLRENWVRDLENIEPSVGHALRLLLAATQYMAVMGEGSASNALRTAVRKLERIVGTTYQSVDATPEFYVAIDENIIPGRESRSLVITYVNDRMEVREREIEPYELYSIGGRWYVEARDPEDDVVKVFRLDRISACRNGMRKFTTPDREHDAIPEKFDLSSIAHTLKVRVRKGFLDAKPDGVVIGDQTPLDDGRVEVDLTVYGERRLDHVLVAIGPDAEIVEPAELRSRRAAHAQALLERLGG